MEAERVNPHFVADFANAIIKVLTGAVESGKFQALGDHGRVLVAEQETWDELRGELQRVIRLHCGVVVTCEREHPMWLKGRALDELLRLWKAV